MSSFPRGALALALLALLAQLSCSGSRDAGDDVAPSSVSDVLADPGVARCAAPPLLDLEATTALQRSLVAKLAGADEIAPGVRLSDRASPENRQRARDLLERMFEAIPLAPQRHAYGTGTNIYSELPSTTGGTEWIVLGAHFDTVARSPGANDNATGVALVVAVARYLTDLPCRSRNVAFVLFDQEEIGLVGSKAFAKKLLREAVAVRSVHTVDQMGWDANGDRLIELERPDAGLADLYRAAASELGVAIPIKVTSTASSNHSSFRPDFPAIGVTEGYRAGDTSPDYHRPTDTFDKVSFPYLLSTTRLVARVLASQLR